MKFIDHSSPSIIFTEIFASITVRESVLEVTQRGEGNKKRLLVPVPQVNRVNGGFLYRIGLLKRIKACSDWLKRCS